MVKRASTESSFLLPREKPPRPFPLKFPLGIASKTVQPYLELIRLEKPTGTKLMFWPFAWALTMAAHRTQLSTGAYALGLVKSLFGAFLIRSSACTVNDIFDRNFDAAVERTRSRPLPSGRISVFAATIYLFAQYVLGVFFFAGTLKGLALQVALFQLLPLFLIYPLMKRITHWPQAWLGFAMNFGYITAWVATTGNFDAPVLAAAMTGCWCWTMLYDTVYACQDIKDDIKAGVRSTAILFGHWIRPLLVGCGLTFVSSMALAGYLNGQGVAYFAISIGGTFTHLVWQYRSVDLDVPQSCWDNFNQNGQLGWILWLGLVVDYISHIYSTSVHAI